MEYLRVSTCRDELDISMIHGFLSTESSWAKQIPRVTLVRAINHSLCFGGYIGKRQVAFARVVTDFATYANLLDMFVLPQYRRRGYGKRLLRTIMNEPHLQGLQRFTLAAEDGRTLYTEFGFNHPSPTHLPVERFFPHMYKAY